VVGLPNDPALVQSGITLQGVFWGTAGYFGVDATNALYIELGF
jgi:hypothetical protein